MPKRDLNAKPAPLPLIDYLHVHHVASYLDCSLTAVYDMVDEGLIPHIRVGKGKKRAAIRISHHAVESWETRQLTLFS